MNVTKMNVRDAYEPRIHHDFRRGRYGIKKSSHANPSTFLPSERRMVDPSKYVLIN